MGRQELDEMFARIGSVEGAADSGIFSSTWDQFVDKSIRKTRRKVTEASLDYLTLIKSKAAANASISKDPDQYTKYYPGHLRDSAYADVGTGKSDEIPGEVGFSAEYAYAHHEEDKEYRYGDVKYLERAVDENGIDVFYEVFKGSE